MWVQREFVGSRKFWKTLIFQLCYDSVKIHPLSLLVRDHASTDPDDPA